MTTLRDMGKTIVISSHILADLSMICSSAAILEQGRLKASGSISELRASVEGKQQVEFSFLETGKDPSQLLHDNDSVESIRHSKKNHATFVLEGGEEEQAKILKWLIDSGVHVCSYKVRETDLEDIFFRVGANQVQ